MDNGQVDKPKDDLRSGWHDKYPWLQCEISCGTGWDVMLNRLFKLMHSSRGKMTEPEDERFSAMQVKEKFGTLRVYLAGKCPQEVDGMISMAEAMSGAICEQCGEPGSMTKHGLWLMTRCTSCR